MSHSSQHPAGGQRGDIYSEITGKIIAQIEAGVLPWVQPWAGGPALSLPKNASTKKAYSGVNILLLWDALFARGFERNQWLTFKQALALGGAVRRGETGTTAVYADSFVPKKEQEAATASGEDARRVAFLKRFTLFNIAQCDGLPADLFAPLAPVSDNDPLPVAEALLSASGAVIQRGASRPFITQARISSASRNRRSFLRRSTFTARRCTNLPIMPNQVLCRANLDSRAKARPDRHRHSA